jgi:hypothetical protein
VRLGPSTPGDYVRARVLVPRNPGVTKRVCYKCGKSGHFIAKCPMSSDSDRGDDKKGKRKEKKKYYKKKGGDAHVCREWDSDESSTDSSSDEDAANIIVNKGLLFPNVDHKCLMAKDDKRKKVYASGGSSWIIDSGCTNHMIGEKRMFSSYKKNEDPQRAITFGDGNQGLVKGHGKIAISPDHSISNVFLVDSLDYNLLSVSQLCKMGYNCLFMYLSVTVFRRSDDSVAFKGVLDGQLYLVDFNRAELHTCLIAKTNMGWLWHRRLAHVGMKNLHKLLKAEHILGLTNVHFEKDRVCSACQAGKQVGTHHPHKNIMTTDRPLELLHMDLFSLIAYISIGGSKYCLVIVDDHSRFTWVFFLEEKSQTQETLKGFLRRAQNEFGLRIKKIRSDNGTEFKNS